jgi:CheY-like chemotaxis protein
MKVLVIEDEPQIREIFAEFVELLGHEADVAVDGRDGLARFDPLVHKIVVTDFLMPGLTGLEIAEAIRARSRTTPIVMISGSAAPQDERRAGQAGCTSFASRSPSRSSRQRWRSRRACRSGAVERLCGNRRRASWNSAR